MSQDTNPRGGDSERDLLVKILLRLGSVATLLTPATTPEPQIPMSDVTVTNFPAVQPVSGSVSVLNFPVSFSVENFPAFPSAFAVNNFPASFAVSNFPASIAVNNLPATQPVSGAVSVSNLPGVQTVGGTVAVSNLPATQPVSAAALPLPAGAATEATLSALLSRLSTNFGKTVNYFSLAQGAAGNAVVAAASPGNRHKVVGFLVTTVANATVQFLSAATPLTGAMDILARGNITMPIDPLSVKMQTAVGEALSITSTGSAAKGFIAFLTEP